METAVTATQIWRLAYVFNQRRRSCESAVPILLAWLKHPDRQVRQEAADSLGRVVLSIRHLPTRRRWAHEAGRELLTYVNKHVDDNLYFARTALGAMGYEPARSYLQQVADTSSGHQRESAERGLLNLENARKTFGE
jgi:HEAT repeat protein